MALINNLISNLGSKDPNKKLLSNVNAGQTTSTMEGQGFTDNQYDSMAQDFAFESQRKRIDAMDAYRSESKRVDNVRSNSARIAKEQSLGRDGAERDDAIFPSWRNSTGEKVFDGDLQNMKFTDSILNQDDNKQLTDPKLYGDGDGLTGLACNTYSCALQREAGATVPEDFSYRRKVDGKMINLKAGDPVPTLPVNQDMDELYPKMGYEHVQLKGANNVHENPNSYHPDGGFTTLREEGSDALVQNKNYNKPYIDLIKEVDDLKGGDIYRSGFHPEFKKNSTTDFNTTHSMTIGSKDDVDKVLIDGKKVTNRNFYQNSGWMGSGVTSKTTSRQNKGTYLRYVGNKPKLKKNTDTASFIANNVASPFKPKGLNLSGTSKLKGNMKGINSLLKKQ